MGFQAALGKKNEKEVKLVYLPIYYIARMRKVKSFRAAGSPRKAGFQVEL